MMKRSFKKKISSNASITKSKKKKLKKQSVRMTSVTLLNEHNKVKLIAFFLSTESSMAEELFPKYSQSLIPLNSKQI